MFAAADPDVQIRGWPVHRESELSGGGGSQNFFSPLPSTFWSKNKGGARAPGAPPLDRPLVLRHYLVLIRQMKAAKNV